LELIYVTQQTHSLETLFSIKYGKSYTSMLTQLGVSAKSDVRRLISNQQCIATYVSATTDQQ